MCAISMAGPRSCNAAAATLAIVLMAAAQCSATARMGFGASFPQSLTQLSSIAHSHSFRSDAQGLLDALLGLHVFHGDSATPTAFQLYVAVLGRNYAHGSSEWQHRLGVFTENSAKIISHNTQSNRSFVLGFNHFTDWTDDEFKAVYLSGFNGADTNRAANSWVPPGIPDPEKAPTQYHPFAYEREVPSKQRVDWREKKVVGQVKDQHINGAPCGCCWAFATMAAVETAYALSTGQAAVSLSEQQAISCDYHDPSLEAENAGCTGGWWWKGLDYVINNGGVASSADYPYVAEQTECDRSKEKQSHAATLTGYEFIDTWNETAMRITVEHQPVLVEVCVGDDFVGLWKAYRSGVYDVEGCYDTIDHGMLVVGFDMGDHGGNGAWMIKNSWGPQWGENGFMRAAMGRGAEVAPGKTKGIFNMYHRPGRPFIGNEGRAQAVRPVNLRMTSSVSDVM